MLRCESFSFPISLSFTTLNIAGVTSRAGGAWAPLAEILEEQKLSQRERKGNFLQLLNKKGIKMQKVLLNNSTSFTSIQYNV